MANHFTGEILKICVGQVCQTIGYQGAYQTPLEVLSDLLHRYLSEVCRLTHRYTEHFGRTEPTLDDLGLTFMDMGISVPELEEYLANVDCPPFPHPMPTIPVPRPSNLNFLKPGSREILSRPIHVHEHLPPMYPEKEEEEIDVKVNVSPMEDGTLDGTVPLPPTGASPTISPQPALKRPAETEGSPAKKAKFSLEDEGQPVREIVSVMMTTSGFISSAREGKLPEARCPDIPLAAPRTTSPSTVAKKKLAVEKLIRHKNNQVVGGLNRGAPPRPPRPNKIKTNKDRMIGKGLKIPKLPTRPLSLPKGGPPGSSPLPPKLKMPLLKPPMPKPPKMPSPKPNTPKVAPNIKASPPKASQSPRPQTPKATSPKIKVPKPPRKPKVEGKKGTEQTKKEGEKEGEVVNKKIKKEKDASKKEGKKEGKKDKEGNKKSKEVKRDKEGRKEGNKETKKEKELKKERDRERERELIIALASSSAVTVTSIPAPGKHPDPPLPTPEKGEGKSKLSIFKKIKTKDVKEEREGMSTGPPQPSRDSSPDLMIDETGGRGRRPPEEPPPDALKMEGDREFMAYPEDMTLTRPRTPEIVHSRDKKRGKDKGREKRPRKDRSKSPKGVPFSPVPHDPDPDPADRPKTPEGGLPMDDLGVPPTPSFLPAFPNAPGFIPPFTRFPFIPPFGGPPPRPGLPPPIHDLRLPHHPHHPFIPRPPIKRPMEEDNLDDNEQLERPPTPRHPREGSPIMMDTHASPIFRSPSPSTPPRPRTPAHHSPPPQPPPPRPHPKPEKTEKEKKKEHKKEKKEKEKEKEKVKKKKEKKDKEKEKSDKKKEKEKIKQEKKKVKKEKEEVGVGGVGGGPKITMKLPSPTDAAPPPPTTPKLVIKPVIKHDSPPPQPPPQPPQPPTTTTTQDDEPGSPEIAKFSALITRPPRSQQKRAESPPALPVLKIKDVTNPMTKHKEVKESGHTPAKVKEVPPLKIKNPTSTSKPPKVTPPTPKQSTAKLPTSPKATTTTTATTPKPPPPTPKVVEEKKVPGVKKPKEKKEKKEKKKDVPAPAPNPLVGTITKPGVGGGTTGESSFPAHTPMPLSSPPLDSAKQSKKQEQKGTGLLTETVGPIGHFVDDQGNTVWICPTCGKQDDGSPMIGCDTCDDWYHWVCVGIQVCPNEEVNWYCPRCISQHRQRSAPPEKKKRGRKKK